MKSKLVFFLAFALITSSCKKKAEETTPSTNIAAGVVTNLNTISTNYTPNSLDKAAARQGFEIQSDPCANETDFAVCQSNLIREYLQIGKSMVDLISQLANSVGGALGN